MFYVGRLQNGGLNMRTVRIGAVFRKTINLRINEIRSLPIVIPKKALINDINGTKRLNEGIWHQLRRGRIIKYSRPGSITVNHLKMAMMYLYRFKKVMFLLMKEELNSKLVEWLMKILWLLSNNKLFLS